MQELTGRCFYHAIGIDNSRLIVNDLLTASVP
jgi:hypothetical protein